jgi:hypothetical protein
VKLKEFVTAISLIVIVMPTVVPAAADKSNGCVRHTSSVPVETCGTQAVESASVKVISTVLVSRSHGSMVPEIVRLSFASRFRSVLGHTLSIVQSSYSSTKLASFSTMPATAVKTGKCIPQVAYFSSVQVIVVVDD